MYRSYMTQEEAERIRSRVHFDTKDRDVLPHCNPHTFHEHGICPYCDSYYANHPGFYPEEFATPEANGWGGNAAPVIDDELAAQEQQEWETWEADITERWTSPKSYWARKAASIRKIFS